MGGRGVTTLLVSLCGWERIMRGKENRYLYRCLPADKLRSIRSNYDLAPLLLAAFCAPTPSPVFMKNFIVKFAVSPAFVVFRATLSEAFLSVLSFFNLSVLNIVLSRLRYSLLDRWSVALWENWMFFIVQVWTNFDTLIIVERKLITNNWFSIFFFFFHSLPIITLHHK